MQQLHEKGSKFLLKGSNHYKALGMPHIWCTFMKRRGKGRGEGGKGELRHNASFGCTTIRILVCVSHLSCFRMLELRFLAISHTASIAKKRKEIAPSWYLLTPKYYTICIFFLYYYLGGILIHIGPNY